VCLNILREDWKPVLNLNSVMVGLQYLFLEPNADDPLNKGSLNLLLDVRACLTTFHRGSRRTTKESRTIPVQC
jgi:ubiquitin-protein ligase